MKRHRFAVIALAVILCFSNTKLLFAQSSESQKPAELVGAITYLADNPGRWTSVALNAAGATTPDELTRESKKTALENNKKGYTKVTDLAYDILCTSAGGYDAATLGQPSLITQLVNWDDMLMQGASGPTFALLALDCCGYEIPDGASWNRDSLCKAILSFQTVDGGFQLDESKDADVDVTAYALLALSRYSADSEVSDAIDNAVQWLMSVQNEDATFSSIGTPSCESTASVIMALISLGIPVSGEQFSKDGISIYDALLSFRCSDGSFSHVLGGGSDSIATTQAIMAMGAVCFGKSPFVLAAVTPPADTAGISITFVLMTIGAVLLIYFLLILVRKMGDYAFKKRKNTSSKESLGPDNADQQDI